MHKVETFFKKNNIDYDLFFDSRTGVYLVHTIGIKPYYNIKGVTVHFCDWRYETVKYIADDDKEIYEAYNHALFTLSNLFYKVIDDEKKAGKNEPAAIQEAIKAQYEYATEHNCIKVFNDIYY